jgi:hypothetical protein
MLESQIEQEERRRVLANDRRVKDQSNTFLGFTHDEVGGRFKEVASSNVVGTTEIPKYPQASHPFQSDPVPPEEPLGYRVDELEPLGPVSPPVVAQAPAPPSAPAPSGSGGGAFSSRPYRRVR